MNYGYTNRIPAALSNRSGPPMSRVIFALALLIPVTMFGSGLAHAGEVTITFQPFPFGAPFDTVTATSCEAATANSYTGYTFLFWNNQGVINWTDSVSVCPGSGNTVATAWYLPTSDGDCIECRVTTYAFSIDHNEVLPSTSPYFPFGTPIAMVSPNSPPDPAWASPSPLVSTEVAENVSAQSTLTLPGFAAEPFRYWQRLGTTTETPIGIVYVATQRSSAYVAAFYGPDPCQTLRNEFASCLEGSGEGGPLKCQALGKRLQSCEIANREIPNPD